MRYSILPQYVDTKRDRRVSWRSYLYCIFGTAWFSLRGELWAKRVLIVFWAMNDTRAAIKNQEAFDRKCIRCLTDGYPKLWQS